LHTNSNREQKAIIKRYSYIARTSIHSFIVLPKKLKQNKFDTVLFLYYSSVSTFRFNNNNIIRKRNYHLLNDAEFAVKNAIMIHTMVNHINLDDETKSKVEQINKELIDLLEDIKLVKFRIEISKYYGKKKE